MAETAFTFPKLDLHLHLDGSISPQLAWELAEEYGIPLPVSSLPALASCMQVPPTCPSLTEYLKCFELPLLVMQRPEALASLTKELVCRLAAQGLVYAELRFAPQLHTAQGLTQAQVVEAVLQGMHEGCTQNPEIDVGLILCTMRGNTTHEQNLETVEVTAQYLGKGVVATDLAGAEALFPTAEFNYVFARARELGLPYTIHSGEVGNLQSVREALALGTKRLGHGIALAQDETLVRRAAQEGIVLECCPTSNLHTKIVPEAGQHPIRKLFDAGVAVTVNTDNMTVSNTTLDKEYHLLCEQLGFTRHELIQMNLNAARAAFVPEEKRRQLIALLEAAR